MIHCVKLNSQYFQDVVKGNKTFEIRFNDRDYKINDELILNEIFQGEYTGNKVKVYITYILSHDDFPEGIPEGYVILNIKLL